MGVGAQILIILQIPDHSRYIDYRYVQIIEILDAIVNV